MICMAIAVDIEKNRAAKGKESIHAAPFWVKDSWICPPTRDKRARAQGLASEWPYCGNLTCRTSDSIQGVGYDNDIGSVNFYRGRLKS